MAISLGILFGILTMLSWGISDFFAAKASRKAGVAKTAVWSQIISVSAFAAIFFLFFDFPNISGANILFIAICSMLGAIGILSLYKGFEVGIISIISPIAASSAVVTIILSLAFLGEKITYLQGFGISLVIIGAILASFKLRDIAKLKLNKVAAGVKYGIIAMLSFGVSFALIGILIENMGWFVPVFLIKSFGLILIVLFSFIMKKELSFPKNAKIFVIIIAILETIAFLSIGAGISYEYTAIVYSVASAFPAVTIILAMIFFKETIELSNKIGAISVLAGLVLLAL